MLANERSRHDEKPVHHDWRGAPTPRDQRKARAATRTRHSRQKRSKMGLKWPAFTTQGPLTDSTGEQNVTYTHRGVPLSLKQGRNADMRRMKPEDLKIRTSHRWTSVV